MNIYELINKGAEVLSKSLDGINGRLESELLLSFVLKTERLYLLLHHSEELKKEECDLFFSYVNRRAEGEPFSYITGTKEFMSLDFSVCPGVLIPRPDTETLVCAVIEKYKDKSPAILDICTGSGAIAVSLAKYIKGTRVDALDISDVCIKTAECNAMANDVASRVSVIKADILKGFTSSKKYDCIVSNPPYIKTDVLPTLMKDVRDFEPALALDGGKDGLVFYRKISALAPALLKEHGMLIFEIGHDQSEEVKEILIENGFKDIEFRKDLADINRVIIGEYV